MSSLIGRFAPGYNTYWMAVWMIIPTAILTALLVVSAVRNQRLMHWVSAALLTASIVLIVGAQLNVQAIKQIKRATHPDWAQDFAHQADQMRGWVMGLAAVSGLLIGLTIWYAGECIPARPPMRIDPLDYNIPWALAIASCMMSMWGVVVDYGEWRRIAILKSQGSNNTFRFADWLHYGLSGVSFALAAAAIVVFVIKWQSARGR